MTSPYRQRSKIPFTAGIMSHAGWSTSALSLWIHSSLTCWYSSLCLQDLIRSPIAPASIIRHRQIELANLVTKFYSRHTEITRYHTQIKPMGPNLAYFLSVCQNRNCRPDSKPHCQQILADCFTFPETFYRVFEIFASNLFIG